MATRRVGLSGVATSVEDSLATYSGQAKPLSRPNILPEPVGRSFKLVELLGKEATFNLVERFGGIRVYIPRRGGHAENALRSTIDEKSLAILIDAYAAEQIKIPLCREWRCVVYRLGGATYDQIALMLCIDISTVHRILNDRFMTGSDRLKASRGGKEMPLKFPTINPHGGLQAMLCTHTVTPPP